MTFCSRGYGISIHRSSLAPKAGQTNAQGIGTLTHVAQKGNIIRSNGSFSRLNGAETGWGESSQKRKLSDPALRDTTRAGPKDAVPGGKKNGLRFGDSDVYSQQAAAVCARGCRSEIPVERLLDSVQEGLRFW